MSMNLEWTIDSMNCLKQSDGLSDVVFFVNWRINGNDDGYSATNYGGVTIEIKGGGYFTDYDNLTKDQVVGWVKSALGSEKVDQIEAGIAESINLARNPVVVSLPLPWETAPEDIAE